MKLQIKNYSSVDAPVTLQKDCNLFQIHATVAKCMQLVPSV